MNNSLEQYKLSAALVAVDLIRDGMLIGIGHGSTVHYAIEAIADRLKTEQLKSVNAVACSTESERKASQLGIPIVELEGGKKIDLTIDGADEIDPSFNLIKGGGGALLREKLVAQESLREIIIADHSKTSPQLGTKFALPVEISQFAWQKQLDFVDALGAVPVPRKHDNDEFVLTDQGNYLLDCDFGPISDLNALASKLDSRAGILEHGLFINLATEVIIAGPDGLNHHHVKNTS